MAYFTFLYRLTVNRLTACFSMTCGVYSMKITTVSRGDALAGYLVFDHKRPADSTDTARLKQ